MHLVVKTPMLICLPFLKGIPYLWPKFADMEIAFNILRQTRANLLNATAQLSEEAMNHIPNGFNNNIIWNLAHCLVTQQLLVYKLSDTPLLIRDELVGLYRKGTRPESPVDSKWINQIRELLAETPEQMVLDVKAGKFGPFKTYSTSFGITLDSVEAAIAFNNVHEGMHLGVILAMRKFV